MKVEIYLNDGSSLSYESAQRVYERDVESLYIYDDQSAVLAIVRKAEVRRLVTSATSDEEGLALVSPRP